MNGSLSTIGYEFVYKVCKRAGEGEDNNIQESMDLGNDVCLNRVKDLYYQGDMLSGGENSASVARVHWESLEQCLDLDMKGFVIEVKGEAICYTWEEWSGV